MTPTERRIQQLEEEKAELRRAVEELSILNDLAGISGGTTELDELLDKIVRTSVRAIGAEEGAIFLVEEETATMNRLVRAPHDGEATGAYRLSTSVLGWMELHKEPLIVEDLSADPRFRDASPDLPTSDGTIAELKSFLAVPMLIRSRLIATLVLFNHHDPGPFTPDDQRLLSIIAAQSAQLIENARLMNKEVELAKVQHEMELAATIQQNLLPSKDPVIEGYEATGRTAQLNFVGGDFYDFIDCGPAGTMICLGDVSGKGVPASLLMSNVHAQLRTQLAHDPSPSAALLAANELLHSTTTIDRFVTLFLLLLDPVTHTITWANAGHTKPIIIGSDGTLRRLDEQSIMLGLTGKATFEERNLELAPGEMLVIYSDGITEEVDEQSEEFGEERLAALLRGQRGDEPAAIVDAVFENVRGFSGTEGAQDDMTIVLLRRKG